MFSTTSMGRRRSGPEPDPAVEGGSVIALGDAADLVGNAGPVVAAILAHMDGTLCVTDEELVAAGPARHGQRLDIGAGRNGEAVRLGVPGAPRSRLRTIMVSATCVPIQKPGWNFAPT